MLAEGSILIVLATLVFFGITAYWDFKTGSGLAVVRGIAALLIAIAALVTLL